MFEISALNHIKNKKLEVHEICILTQARRRVFHNLQMIACLEGNKEESENT
jgi:hypothetical protein